MNFTEQDFKLCLGSFATGVTVVTTIDASFEPQGVTVSSFSSLSLEPPMVAFNLGKESYLHSKLLNSDVFAINILSNKQASISRQFAAHAGDKWSGIKYELGTHGCPILDGTLSYIECMTDNIYDGGDHSIITGKVVNLHVAEGVEPLLHYRGKYFSLGEEL